MFIDKETKFVRAPIEGNRPLEMFSNRWSTMPIHAYPTIRLPRPDRRATLEYMPGSDVPVIRQPFTTGDEVPFWARMNSFHGDVVFNRKEDPLEEQNLVKGTSVEASSSQVEAMREALKAIEAPSLQFERLALS